MRIKLLGDRILVKRGEGDEKLASGIIIPGSNIRETYVAEVHAVGAGKVSKKGVTLPMALKAGDKVIINRYVGSSASEYVEDGKSYLVMHEHEVLLVL